MTIYPEDIGKTLIAYVSPGYIIHILPRSRHNLFQYQRNSNNTILQPEKVTQYSPLSDYLENFLGEAHGIKDIEKRMYLDLCRPFPGPNDTPYCLRQVTVLIKSNTGDRSDHVPYFPGPFTPSDEVLKPNESKDSKAYKLSCQIEKLDPKNLHITLVSGSQKTRFVHDGKLVTEINVKADTMIDRNGLAEITIAHPVEPVAAADAKIKIKVALVNETKSELSHEELELQLLRNDAVATLEDIGKRGTDSKADKILVCQSTHAVDHAAMTDLKKICNQVIPRHQQVTGYPWLDEDNKQYDVNLKTALGKFIDAFKNIRSGNDAEKDYPYSLECFGKTGIDADLAKHISSEYGIDYASNLGIVLDRNLLVGAKSSTSLKDTDGLLDLHENVVKKYIHKVYEISEEYRTQNVSWFHNPNFGGAKDDLTMFEVGSITLSEDKIQYTTQEGNETKKKTINGQQVDDTIAKGTTFHGKIIIKRSGVVDLNNQQNTRIRVSHQGGDVWIVLTVAEWGARDDRGIAKNLGNYGEKVGEYDYTNYGVPYCYGGKNSLGHFQDRLQKIGDNLKNWNQYPAKHQVDFDGDGDNDYQNVVGLDCNGLVQNCLTHMVFDSNNNFRIIPDSLMSAYTYTATNTALAANEILCSANLTKTNGARYAATLPHDQRKFMTRGDLIVDPNNPHIGIVTVAEDVYPCARDNDNRDFAVTHNYGGPHALRNKKDGKYEYNSSYVHKTIRSPFYGWMDKWDNIVVGRVMLWG